MSPPSIPGFGQTGVPAGGGGYSDPSEDPTKDEYYSSKLLTPPWIQAGFPDYQSYAANLRLKEELARGLQEKQINASSAGSGATVAAASISTQGANQRAAAQAEIDRAKNAADQAHDAGLLALQNGNAAEARRQFDISSQELQRYHTADIGLRQQDQSLASAKFGNDVYNKLAELASNPRNYMEQFFRMRGQTPPAGSSAYGNTSVTGPGLATFEQFLPQFLKSTGLGGAYGANAPAAQGAAPTATGASGGSFGQSANLSEVQNPGSTSYMGYKIPTTSGPSLAVTPKPLQVGAAVPGTSFTDANGVAGLNINTGDSIGSVQAQQAANPKETALVNGKPTPIFAHGGSLRMTAPHAIINLLSGKVSAIAGEERGKGPHGYVPETAKFDGKALIKDSADSLTSDPYFTDPGTPASTPDPTPTPSAPYVASGLKAPGGGLAYPYDPTMATAAPDQSTVDAMIAAAGFGPNPPIVDRLGFATGPEMAGAPTTTTPHPDTTVQSTPAPSPFQAMPSIPTTPPAPLAPATDYGSLLYSQNAPASAYQAPVGLGGTPAPAPSPFQLPNGVLPGPVTQTAPNPGPAPAPVVTPTNIPNPTQTFNVPDYLRQTPSGIGNNPKFLPEDQAATDPIIAQMLAAGTFPPFLQRIFAQQKGLAGLGTNVPQATELPPGVPLVSKLAYSQMTPNERSAFESYLSAHGLDLPTYLSLVEAASPQGGTSSVNPAIPKFLQQ